MKKAQDMTPKQEPAKLTARDVLKYIITHSCVYYTAIALILLIGQAVSVDTGEIAFIEPTRFLMLYPFTLCVAVAGCVFFSKSLKVRFKILIHYAVSAIAFYTFICAPAKNSTNPAAIIALASVLYFIAAGVILTIRYVKNKKRLEETPYQSVYSKITKK